MRRGKQLAASTLIAITISLSSVCARASDLDSDATALSKLQVKAEQAPLRDRCFLYAELVGHLADRAGQQFHSGDAGEASESLRMLGQYAGLIDSTMSADSRQLKNAELLTRRASFRLSNLLHNASYEDRDVLDATLKLVNQAQTNLMMQVFKR
jgi:hypothetical protein